MADQAEEEPVKAQERYLSLAKSFRDQFSQVSTEHLMTLARLLGHCDDEEKVANLFHDKSVMVAYEPMWSFMHTATILVVLTELENRRGVK